MSASNNDSIDLQTEVSLAEAQIRSATGFGVYSIIYDATIIGNPAIDPRADTDCLPQPQQAFYNAFVEAGYLVGRDSDTGRWYISWNTQGSEKLVAVYSFRTSINPSVVVDETITAITNFFLAQRPVTHVIASYNGFIDEAGFGGSSSTFYEFTIVADQQTDTTNYSSQLKTYLTAQGLGYNSGNCAVYQLVS